MEQLLLIIICALSLTLATFLFQKAKKLGASVRLWAFGLLACSMIPFGLAWYVSSFYEGEPYAGYMGIIIFSGIGLICLLLAYNQLKREHPALFPQPTPQKAGLPVGVVIAVFILGLLGAVLLPYTIAFNRLASQFGNQEKIREAFQHKLLSDDSLPYFIKKTLGYHTLYGDYPETLEERLMQSMISGVKDEELIVLLNKIAPEPERYQLLQEAVTSGAAWMDGETDYPELTLQLGPYLDRINQNAEFVMTWLYRNFPFPPMEPAAVAKVHQGEFSDQIADYMTTPPDSIKSLMIRYGAKALEMQLARADAPSQVVLADQMSAVVSAGELNKQKVNVKRATMLLKSAWILAALLLLSAFVLTFWKIPKPLRIASYLALGIALAGFLAGSPLRDVHSSVYQWIDDIGMTETAPPAPVFTLIHQFLPEVLLSTKAILFPVLNAVLFTGFGFLIFSYRQRLMHMIGHIKRYPSNRKPEQLHGS